MLCPGPSLEYALVSYDQGYLFSSIAYGVPLCDMSKVSLELACQSGLFYAASTFARASGYRVFSKRFLLVQVQYSIHPDFGNGAFTSNFAELLNPRICSISNACNASALQQAFEYVDLAIHARDEARPEQQLALVVGLSRHEPVYTSRELICDAVLGFSERLSLALACHTIGKVR